MIDFWRFLGILGMAYFLGRMIFLMIGALENDEPEPWTPTDYAANEIIKMMHERNEKKDDEEK